MKDYEELDNQIGGIGNEEPKKGLGKLKHIPGTKEELNNDEKISFAKFNELTKRTTSTNDIKDGWIPFDRGELGTRSMFYPEDWEFRVKPATVEAIKNWSSIDENSLASINNVMNEIIKSCVSIKSANGPIRWDKLNSWDRFFFILKVREYTFQTGEQALEFDEECDNCNENIHFSLKSDQLYYEYPDQEVIDKNWNFEKCYWNIVPADYGISGYAPLKLYIPNLQKDDAILKWLYTQQEAGKNLDEPFVKFVPYMLEKAPKDSNLLDKMIRDCHKEFKSWDTDMFLFMDEVRRNIIIEPSEKLFQKCPNCGEEVISSVKFPNGIKYLFNIPNRHTKFGSK